LISLAWFDLKDENTVARAGAFAAMVSALAHCARAQKNASNQPMRFRRPNTVSSCAVYLVSLLASQWIGTLDGSAMSALIRKGCGSRSSAGLAGSVASSLPR